MLRAVVIKVKRAAAAISVAGATVKCEHAASAGAQGVIMVDAGPVEGDVPRHWLVHGSWRWASVHLQLWHSLGYEEAEPLLQSLTDAEMQRNVPLKNIRAGNN
jgi:hypothetical protein